ncbi:MAG: DUF2812 domain-containing protein [Clostridia bacterium]|nr:DUF2812 domain-containing protein [Clostridia bacterium]
MKKNKNEFTEFFGFDYTELFAVAEYLQLQEERGFRLKEFRSHFWVFEKSEPKKIRYTAVLFRAKGTMSRKEFIEMCECEGWEFVALYNDELYIFRTENENAVDIMTDEAEKLKIIAKRAWLQPGFLGLSFYSLWFIFKFIFFKSDFDPILEASSYQITELLIAVYLLSIAAIRIFCYLFRVVRSKSRLSAGKDINFVNLRAANKKQSFFLAFEFVALMGVIIILSLLDGGYFQERAVYWIFAAILVVLILPEKRDIHSKGKSAILKRAGLCLFLSATVIAGTLGLIKYNEAKSVEASKALLNTEAFINSFSELEISHVSTEATGLAQLYRFEINDIEVLVSDYPHIRRKYINKILDDHIFDGHKNKAEIVETAYPQTKWDICYLEVIEDNGERRYAGLAVKDNLVLFVRRSVDEYGDRLFETAYEKIFE